MKTLKQEYEDLHNDFLRDYADRGCTCFISPPCSFCVHEGNPANLEETPDAWIEVTKDGHN